jgi:acetylornithine deacetylase/succinyl-diaminopimelate desuccinylase-like protein
MKDFKELFTYVDEHWGEMFNDLQEYCSCRSVAGNQEGLAQAKDYVLNKMNDIGIKREIINVKNGNPMIFGHKHGAKGKSLLFYNHYDVVEEGKHNYWKNEDPFKVVEENGVLYGRGISDNKGPLLSRLHAVQAILAVEKGLPINVKFLVEGDEESASPSMFSYVKDNHEQFSSMVKADACLWENGRIDENGRPWARFGVRGNCSFDMKVTTCNKDLHGRMGATVPSASWRLIWALNSLKGIDEQIKIDGFYDDVIQPTKEDLKVLKDFPYNEEKVKAGLNLKEFLLNSKGEELKQRMYLEPTLSVCGIEAGELYNGPRGIVPHTAMARISFYLVVAQNPDNIHKLLREHLDKHGFSDVQLIFKGGSTPVKTPINIPFKEQLVEAAAVVYGKPMVIELTQLGAGPAIVFKNACEDMPIVGIGPGNTNSNHHAPNENLTIEDYKNAVKHIIALMYTF